MFYSFYCGRLLTPPALLVTASNASRLLGRNYHEVSYRRAAKFGALKNTCQLKRRKIPGEPETQHESRTILVSMISAPLTHADDLSMQNWYPSPFDQTRKDGFWHTRHSEYAPGRSIAGHEGWGKIIEIRNGGSIAEEIQFQEGSEQFTFKVGDYVTPAVPSLGTFRSSLWVEPRQIVKVERGKELFEAHPLAASVFFHHAGAALRMLENVGNLQRGDVVMQNAGNSTMGIILSQLVRNHFGASMVSAVRRGNRSERQFEEMVKNLTESAQHNVVIALEGRNVEDVVRSKIIREFGKLPVLALNGIGGPSVGYLLKLLEKDGTLISYGGTSNLPISFGSNVQVYWNKTTKGYWHHGWLAQEATYNENHALIQKIADLVLSGLLQLPPVEFLAFNMYAHAFDLLRGQNDEVDRKKIIFDCQSDGLAAQLIDRNPMEYSSDDSEDDDSEDDQNDNTEAR
jgi:trans-2-enoyl-CoA reductase